jgi:hypothetical protein
VKLTLILTDEHKAGCVRSRSGSKRGLKKTAQRVASHFIFFIKYYNIIYVGPIACTGKTRNDSDVG